MNSLKDIFPTRNFHIIPLILFLAAQAFLCSPLSAAEKEYNWAYSSKSRSNKIAEINLLEFSDKIIESIHEKTGIKITIKDIDETEGLKNGAADMAMLAIETYSILRMDKVETEPLVLLSIFDKPGFRTCVYAGENCDSLDCLKGTSAAVYSFDPYAAYVPLRKKMAGSGFDMPLADFFNEFHTVYSAAEAYQALAYGKVQAIMEIDWLFDPFRLALPEKDEINTVACSDEYPGGGVFVRKGIDKTDAEKLTAYFIEGHKSPIFKDLRILIAALKAKFVPPAAGVMEVTHSLYEEALEKGWLEEMEKWMKETGISRNGQKPDDEKSLYKKCKEKCLDSQNKPHSFIKTQ